MTTLLETLETLTASLTATETAITSPDFPSIHPPENGISLLDLKNELLLSYLHNLVFLILVKLRSGSLDPASPNGAAGSAAVKDLVKLRVFLEKGVRPLESKLKYQIDKVVAAAVDSEKSHLPTKPNEDEDDDDSDDESDVSHDDYGHATTKSAPAPTSALTNKELSFRPNPAALLKPFSAPLPSKSDADTDKEGVYKPPRISATTMPDLPTTNSDPDARAAQRRQVQKSHTLDEFIADELSTAPLAEPSIGSTIAASGRIVKSAKDRREEAERTAYEENNFVRLPKLSKKELREQKKRSGGKENMFAGEDWNAFAGDVNRLTRGVDKGKSAKALERSRKRKGEGEPGDGDGEGRRMGAEFKRRKGNLKRRR
ncbi:hypothetical protein RUND412_004180 [Rhizina undulata]